MPFEFRDGWNVDENILSKLVIIIFRLCHVEKHKLVLIRECNISDFEWVLLHVIGSSEDHPHVDEKRKGHEVHSGGVAEVQPPSHTVENRTNKEDRESNHVYVREKLEASVSNVADRTDSHQNNYDNQDDSSESRPRCKQQECVALLTREGVIFESSIYNINFAGLSCSYNCWEGVNKMHHSVKNRVEANQVSTHLMEDDVRID